MTDTRLAYTSNTGDVRREYPDTDLVRETPAEVATRLRAQGITAHRPMPTGLAHVIAAGR